MKYKITNFLSGEIVTSGKTFETLDDAKRLAIITVNDYVSYSSIWKQAKKEYQIIIEIIEA